MRSLLALCRAGVVSLGALPCAAAAPMHPAVGHVVGDIVIAGGPAPGTVSRHEAGTVVIRTLGGRTIERRRVKAAHGYRFALRPGRYRVLANADRIRGPNWHRYWCQAPHVVTVRPGHTVRADAICSIK